MQTDARSLYDQAMKLPADDREILAAQIMGSIEPSESETQGIKNAWIEEIDRRVAKLETGQSKPLPIEEAWPKLTGKPWNGTSDNNG